MKTLKDLSEAPMEALDVPEPEYIMPISHLAHVALSTPDFKDVTNLTAIFGVVTKELQAHAKYMGQNYIWVNRHPVSVIFINRLAELAGINEPSARVLDAIECCRELINA